MGSCISINRPLVPPKKVKKHRKTKLKCTRKQCRKFPPPAPPASDEEKVKEVLSETPTFQKQPSPPPKPNQASTVKAAPPVSDFSNLLEEKHPRVPVAKKPGAAVERNELPAEICGAHGGGVVGSAGMKEKRDIKRHANDKPRERSPARLRSRPPPPGEVKRDKTLGKSPGRAPEPTSERSRPGSISSSAQARKKDIGEISGRRSRSPVLRTNGGSSRMDLGRSPSSRRLGKSPSRVGSGLGDRIRRGDEGNKWPPTSNEFLENPVVSLECFIFL